MNTDLTLQEWAEKLKVTDRRAFELKGRVKGSYYRSGRWWIPKGAPDPRKPHGRPAGWKKPENG